MTIAVLQAGAWGTTLATILARDAGRDPASLAMAFPPPHPARWDGAAAPDPAGAKAAPARKPAPTQPKVVKPAVPSLTALKRDLHARLIEAIADFATTCELPADLTRADVLDDISKVCAYIPTSGWDARLTQHSLGGRNPNKDIPITTLSVKLS